MGQVQRSHVLVDARDGRCVGYLGAIGLFLVEPFFLDRRLHRWAANRPASTFAWLRGSLDLAHAQPGCRLRRGRREPWMAGVFDLSFLANRRRVIAEDQHRVSVWEGSG